MFYAFIHLNHFMYTGVIHTCSLNATWIEYTVPADVIWKSIDVGVFHWADELFDNIPVEPFRTSPGGTVPANWKRSVARGGTDPTVNSSPESERRMTKTCRIVARRLLVLALTDPTGRQMLAAQSTRQNVNRSSFRDMVLMQKMFLLNRAGLQGSTTNTPNNTLQNSTNHQHNSL